MAMPEFTAGASAYRPTRGYPAFPSHPAPSDRILPAQRLESDCGPCHCEPGKCCELTLFGCHCYTCGGAAYRLPRPVFRSA